MATVSKVGQIQPPLVTLPSSEKNTLPLRRDNSLPATSHRREVRRDLFHFLRKILACLGDTRNGSFSKNAYSAWRPDSFRYSLPATPFVFFSFTKQRRNRGKTYIVALSSSDRHKKHSVCAGYEMIVSHTGHRECGSYCGGFRERQFLSSNNKNKNKPLWKRVNSDTFE